MYTVTLYRICTYVWCVIYQLVLYNILISYSYFSGKHRKKYRLIVCIILEKNVSSIKKLFLVNDKELRGM